MVRYIKAVIAITRKDLIAEFRTRELLTSMLVFSLISIIIFNFALDLEPRLRSTITPGVLWVTFIFAGTISLNRSMAIEKDRDCLEGLLLSPLDHTTILSGKILGNLLFMGTIELLVLMIYSFLYNTNVLKLELILVLFLGSLGYITVGIILSTMTIHTRMRDMFLPVLLFPVTMPVLLAAVKASGIIMLGLEMGAVTPWINILLGYDIIFLAVAYMVFDLVVQE